MLKTFVACVAFAFGALAISQEKPKEAPKPVGEMAPHPLDKVFETATTPTDVDNALINNKHFEKAVKAALEAKEKTAKNIEELRKKGQNYAGPSPKTAARAAFLRALEGNGPDE